MFTHRERRVSPFITEMAVDKGGQGGSPGEALASPRARPGHPANGLTVLTHQYGGRRARAAAPKTAVAIAPKSSHRLLPGAHRGGLAHGASRYGPAVPSVHAIAFRPAVRAVEEDRNTPCPAPT